MRLHVPALLACVRMGGGSHGVLRASAEKGTQQAHYFMCCAAAIEHWLPCVKHACARVTTHVLAVVANSLLVGQSTAFLLEHCLPDPLAHQCCL